MIIPCVRNFLFIFLLWLEEGSSVQSLQKFVCTFVNSEQNFVSGVWQGSLSHYFRFLFKKQQQSQKAHNILSAPYLHRSSSSPSYMQNSPFSPQPCALMVLNSWRNGIYDSDRFLICHQNAAVSEKPCYLFWIPAHLSPILTCRWKLPCAFKIKMLSLISTVLLQCTGIRL